MMKMTPIDLLDRLPVGTAGAAKTAPANAKDAAQVQAERFEAVFIAEMLKHGGFADALSQNAGFGGEAYSTMLLEKYADKMVESGGFGLAKHIYAQLSSETGDGTQSEL